MKELSKRIALTFVVAALVFAVAACGGETTENKGGRKKMDLPAFFQNPPTAEDAIYAVGYAKKENLQLAAKIAANRARDEISSVISVKVTNMVKDFLEEAGVSGESVSTEYSSSVSKSITSNFLSGSKIEEQEFYETETGSVEAYVLVKVSLSDMTSKIDEVMKNNAAAYAKLQANKGFEELSEELKKMEGGTYGKTDPAAYGD